MATADLAAAQRAADQLVEAGVGRVLLFGSVARGKATARSDVDLVAIYDDLDYGERHRLRLELEAHAREAAGCPVDVRVTDAPEWRRRTTGVPSSFEASIAPGAVQIADACNHAAIEWDKEIGLPDTDRGELQYRLEDMTNAVGNLGHRLHPDRAEEAAAADGDPEAQQHHEGLRFASAMAQVLAIVESAAKAAHVMSLGTAPERTHQITGLLGPQPAAVAEMFVRLAGDALDLDGLHVWRQGATYAEDRPELPSEQVVRAACAAALAIGAAVVEMAHGHDITQADLAPWRRMLNACNNALASPIRLP